MYRIQCVFIQVSFEYGCIQDCIAWTFYKNPVSNVDFGSLTLGPFFTGILFKTNLSILSWTSCREYDSKKGLDWELIIMCFLYLHPPADLTACLMNDGHVQGHIQITSTVFSASHFLHFLLLFSVSWTDAARGIITVALWLLCQLPSAHAWHQRLTLTPRWEKNGLWLLSQILLPPAPI